MDWWAYCNQPGTSVAILQLWNSWLTRGMVQRTLKSDFPVAILPSDVLTIRLNREAHRSYDRCIVQQPFRLAKLWGCVHNRDTVCIDDSTHCAAGINGRETCLASCLAGHRASSEARGEVDSFCHTCFNSPLVPMQLDLSENTVVATYSWEFMRPSAPAPAHAHTCWRIADKDLPGLKNWSYGTVDNWWHSWGEDFAYLCCHVISSSVLHVTIDNVFNYIIYDVMYSLLLLIIIIYMHS